MKSKRKIFYLTLLSALAVFSVVSLFLLPYKVLFALLLTFTALAILLLYIFGGGDLSSDNSDRKNFSKILIVEDLDRLFSKKKPFLDVNYKISDLEKQLNVSRGAINEFTKKKYRRNFNQFLNLWRIAELQRLQALPENQDVSINILCLKAGFSSAQQYHLAEKERRQINRGKSNVKPVTKPITNDSVEDLDISKKPEIQLRI